MKNDDYSQESKACEKGTGPKKSYKNLKQKQKLKIAGWMFESTCSYYREHGRMPAGDACGKLAAEIHRKMNNFVPGISYEEVYSQYLRKLPRYEKRIAENGLSEVNAENETAENSLPEKDTEMEKSAGGDAGKDRKEKTAGRIGKKKGSSNKRCPACGRKMKQQFIGLQHCRCGMSWQKDVGYFERDSSMVFALERRKVGKKVKQCPVIRHRDN